MKVSDAKEVVPEGKLRYLLVVCAIFCVVLSGDIVKCVYD